MKRKPVLIAAMIAVSITVIVLAGKYYTEAVIQKKMANTVDKASKYIHVTYEDVSVGLPTMSVRMDNVALNDVRSDLPLARIKRCILHDIETREDTNTITRMKIELQGMELSREAVAAFRPAMNRLDLTKKNLPFNFLVDYDYHPESKQLFLNRVQIDAPGLGALRISGKTNGIHLDFSHPNASLFGTALEGALVSATIEYQDSSLVPRLLTAAATTKGKSRKEIQKEVIDEIRRMGSTTGKNDASELIGEVEKFLDAPGRLLVTATPAAPVLFNRLVGFSSEKLARILNLHIIAQ